MIIHTFCIDRDTVFLAAQPVDGIEEQIQIAAGRGAVGKGGIVKRNEDRETAVLKVIESAELSGLHFLSLMRSPIEGGDGNVEFLARFTKKDIKSPFDKREIRNIVFGKKGG